MLTLLTQGCRLVVITTDDWLTTKHLRRYLCARYPFLYDTDKTLRDELDIWDYSDPQHVPMIPHTFLLAPGLHIHRVWNGHYYWGRPSTRELQAELRQLTHEMQRDGNLSDLELTRQWDAGDRHDFYSRGSKSSEQGVKETARTLDQYAGLAR